MNTPSHEEIANRAYELWIAEGSPQGRDIGIWLAAEQQLKTGPAKSEEEATKDRLIGEMASESAIENQLSPAPSDQEAIRAALRKNEAGTAQKPVRKPRAA